MRTTNAIASAKVGSSKVLAISSPVRTQPGSAAIAAATSASGRSGVRAIDPHSTPAARLGHTRAVPMDLPDSEAPTSVELDRAVGLTLRWADGTESHFDLEELRRSCPCAECRGLRE